jgi:hypothetical protein
MKIKILMRRVGGFITVKAGGWPTIDPDEKYL